MISVSIYKIRLQWYFETGNRGQFNEKTIRRFTTSETPMIEIRRSQESLMLYWNTRTRKDGLNSLRPGDAYMRR